MKTANSRQKMLVSIHRYSTPKDLHLTSKLRYTALIACYKSNASQL